MRKIDVRLLPILFVIYVAAFLDRVNISNALTMGLQKDLHLTGNQPNVALAIFFIPYVVFEIPSNILLKRLTPRVWLSGCTVGFGVAMLAQGFVKNYAGLLTTRFVLGLAETGMFPGSKCKPYINSGFYLISFWYNQHESQKRFSFYWCSVLVAGAFGGLLASGIAKMDGVSGLHNWRWVFILEGLGTVVLGIISYFLISDFPERAKWLTERERAFVKHRTGHDKFVQRSVSTRDILWFFKSPRRVLGAFIYWGVIVPIYSYSYFAPTIIKSLGYNVVQTQLRSVPPFVAALVLCLGIAYVSDWTRVRMVFVAFGLTLAIIGLAILMSIHHHFPTQYAGLCLVAMGSFSAGIGIICWYVMNLHGHVERSIGSAWMISFGNTGGIVATFTFLAKDAPFYRKGYAICMGAVCVSVVSTIAYAGLILKARKANKKGHDASYAL
ncbi:putative allantoate permease [Lentithecium fluviatile CBS 122367]|uniref:Putative allantoate permease n=1 Tax=Lentithecium fluviatile CBS 122367 TaxID=1168545 RepID=A0A6G1INS4_9PLEO|nr:putative allantoate permease [Lentithecium fluviatile CBS 122367]